LPYIDSILKEIVQSPDQALIAGITDAKGGIDLNSSNLQMQIKG
jgi:hypothetical protein